MPRYESIVRVRANGVLLEFPAHKCDGGMEILEWLDKRFPPIPQPARDERWEALQASMKEKKSNAARASRNVR